ALRRLVAALSESDRPAGIVVDGPLGPPGVPKPGVLFCARETGRPIVPLGVAARGKIEFRASWSRIYLPLPGARIVIACGETVAVSSDETRGGMDRLGAELEARLASARVVAEGNSRASRAGKGALRTRARERRA
ncbi:MAG TPA: hypothetical protein VG777_05310, partial [Thermoanaerobaculia bacterium]|nr:hypothetical protein [Thermoanaerobaculia bacterium]